MTGSFRGPPHVVNADVSVPLSHLSEFSVEGVVNSGCVGTHNNDVLAGFRVNLLGEFDFVILACQHKVNLRLSAGMFTMRRVLKKQFRHSRQCGRE